MRYSYPVWGRRRLVPFLLVFNLCHIFFLFSVTIASALDFLQYIVLSSESSSVSAALAPLFFFPLFLAFVKFIIVRRR